MTASDHYRARVQAVRQAARARLAEIRAERSARMRATEPQAMQASEPAPAAPPLVFTASASASLLAAQAIEVAVGVTPEAAAPTPEPQPQPSEARTAAAPLEPEAELATSEPNPVVEEVPPRELAALPGIGPGLVWILEQSGVRSLADLAATDPEQLRARIGFVGGLINLDAWIAFARSARP